MGVLREVEEKFDGACMGVGLILNEVLTQRTGGDGANGCYGVGATAFEGVEIGGVYGTGGLVLGDHSERVHFELRRAAYEHFFDGDGSSVGGGGCGKLSR